MFVWFVHYNNNLNRPIPHTAACYCCFSGRAKLRFKCINWWNTGFRIAPDSARTGMALSFHGGLAAGERVLSTSRWWVGSFFSLCTCVLVAFQDFSLLMIGTELSHIVGWSSILEYGPMAPWRSGRPPVNLRCQRKRRQRPWKRFWSWRRLSRWSWKCQKWWSRRSVFFL